MPSWVGEDGLKRFVALVRGLPPGAALFMAGAVLFLGGAIWAAWHGVNSMMRVGLVGAAVAIGVTAFACDWSGRGRRR